jgi:GNAT superfamily N-acetyltransferase
MSTTISRLCDLPADVTPSVGRDIEAIFWETTAAPPVDAVAREGFRAQWFGQYLHHDPGLVFVAINAHGAVGGYLVGTFASLATSPRFAALPYATTFAAAVARYPAHLHLNLTASWRGRGVGRLLIAAFVAQVRAAGLPGCHVVTGAASRNVSFYTREGFQEIDRSSNGRGKTVLFLGRDVA